MEARHSRGKWKKKILSFILVWLAFLSQAASHPETINGEIQNNTVCLENEYLSSSGFCCDKCTPGFKLKEECKGKGLRSVCEKCGDGTYQDKTNYYRNCFSCYKCNKKHEVVKKACSHLQDTVCLCTTGYYKKVIGPNTMNCERCRVCGNGEYQVAQCQAEKDTDCQCQHSYYRVNKNTCELCKNCSSSCLHLCPAHFSPTPVIPQKPSHKTPEPAFPLVYIVAFSLLPTVIMGFIYLGKLILKWRKRKHALSSDPENQVGNQSMTFICASVQNVERMALMATPMMKEQNQLPDCVPREIKTHEFLYYILECVPVNRFKELVRRLNVSEQDIDRAMHDNRVFFDAQYQMLKVWIDSQAGGGKTVLPRPLLQECVDRLKDMCLNGCAESIESKYCTETLPNTLSSCT